MKTMTLAQGLFKKSVLNSVYTHSVVAIIVTMYENNVFLIHSYKNTEGFLVYPTM